MMRSKHTPGRFGRRLSLFILSAGVATFTGCRQSQRPLLVGVPLVTAEEMWEGMHAGLLDGATQNGYVRYWNGPTHPDDVNRQIAILEKQMDRGLRGIALAPTNALQLISVVGEAQARHIPVVLMESELAEHMGPGVVSVQTDNKASGQMAADYLASRLPPGSEVALLGADPALGSNYVRSIAFAGAVTSVGKLRLVDRRFGDSSGEEAESSLRQILAAHPHLRGLFATSLTATRAAHAVLAPEAERRIVLIGADQDRDVEELVRDGEVDAIVAQDAYGIGLRSAENLVAMDRGQTVPALTLLAPHLFTRANIDSADAHRILVNYTGWTQQLCTFCRAHEYSSQ